MTYFALTADGQRIGPLEKLEVRQCIREGRLHGTDKIEVGGSGSWTTISETEPFDKLFGARDPAGPMYLAFSADGEKIGPLEGFEVRQLLRVGRLHPGSQIQRVGETTWTTIADAEDFRRLFAGPSEPDDPLASRTGCRFSSRPGDPTYERLLAFAILATLLGCLPIGIPALVYASFAVARSGAGDVVGAEDASRTATGFLWLSLIGWMVLVIFVLLTR